jgi:cytoskeletal protein CcmA (bactofilin family)
LLEVTEKPDMNQSNGRRGATATVPAERKTSHAGELYVPENSLLNNPAISTVPVLLPVPKESKSYQTRLPVITGEVHYRGMLHIDGVLLGQPGSNGGSLGVRQKSGSVFASQPELSGEINFRDMVRVNGHIAGTVYSKSGTLIVDTTATVDANVEVAVAVIGGTVRGDIVAHERIELGPRAKIYGNIWTRSIAIKDGAVFDGVCTMIGGCRTSD